MRLGSGSISYLASQLEKLVPLLHSKPIIDIARDKYLDRGLCCPEEFRVGLPLAQLYGLGLEDLREEVGSLPPREGDGGLGSLPARAQESG